MTLLSKHGYVSPDSQIGFPELRAGFVPHAGSAYLLSRQTNGVGGHDLVVMKEEDKTELSQCRWGCIWP